MAKDFDPSEHNVQEVNDYIAKHPDQADAIHAAERAGKARAGVIGPQEPTERQDAHLVTETGHAPASSGGRSNEDLERAGLRLPENY